MHKKCNGFILFEIIVAISLIAIISFLGYRMFTNKQATPEPQPSMLPKPMPNQADFITHNPVNVDQVLRISKFRSCAGHDYSGLNVEGETESNRSMKHYIAARTSSPDAYMPFDGKVAEIREERAAYGKQIWLIPEPDNDWVFIFFHVVPKEGVKQGSQLKSGELLGNSPIKYLDSFDYTLARFSSEKPIYESPFLHMESNVLEQYSDRGINTDNIIISKLARDAKSCTFGALHLTDWVNISNQ